MPVITLTVLFGAERWDGPVCLHDMFGEKKKEILQYVQDYRLNLIVPATMDKEDLDKLHTSLREVFEYIKYSKDKKKLKEIVQQNERYRSLEREAAAVINAVTHSELKLEEREEKINMCKAIDDMRQESFEEGIAQGLRQAIRLAVSNGGSIDLVAKLFGQERKFVEEMMEN